jgi:hypothetical protein
MDRRRAPSASARTDVRASLAVKVLNFVVPRSRLAARLLLAGIGVMAVTPAAAAAEPVAPTAPKTRAVRDARNAGCDATVMSYAVRVSAAEPARRVVVAVVPGAAGARIQAWREAHDGWRARLLPPHLTLCYRPPRAPDKSIEAQVRHAFPAPVPVRLGGVAELPNRDRTLVVEVLDAAQLDLARRRLFDATFVEMGGYREWPWHITWVRYGIKRDSAALLALAEHGLRFDEPWTIDTISLLELQNGRYEPVAEWRLGS